MCVYGMHFALAQCMPVKCPPHFTSFKQDETLPAHAAWMRAVPCSLDSHFPAQGPCPGHTIGSYHRLAQHLHSHTVNIHSCAEVHIGDTQERLTTR